MRADQVPAYQRLAAEARRRAAEMSEGEGLMARSRSAAQSIEIKVYIDLAHSDDRTPEQIRDEVHRRLETDLDVDTEIIWAGNCVGDADPF
jgi:hypothetical protein